MSPAGPARLGSAGHPVIGAPSQERLVAALTASVSTPFQSEVFALTCGEVDAFESVTWVDRVPLSSAAAASYPDELVEGFHLLALLDPLVSPHVARDPATTYLVNYGIDRARFVRPAVAGQRLCLRGQVTEAAARGERGCLVRIACTFVDVAHGATIAVADWLVLVLPASVS